MTANAIALFVFSGRPTFGHSTGAVIEIVVGIVWLFLMRLSASTTDDLERVLGNAVLEALHLAKLTTKEACALMGVDYFHFQAAVKGEKGRHIALSALMRLPILFWMAFLPTLSYMVVRKNVIEVAEDLGVRRSV